MQYKLYCITYTDEKSHKGLKDFIFLAGTLFMLTYTPVAFCFCHNDWRIKKDCMKLAFQHNDVTILGMKC